MSIDDLIEQQNVQVVDADAVPAADDDEKKAKKAKNARKAKTNGESTEGEFKPERKVFSAGVSHPILSGKMPDELVFLIRQQMVYNFAQREEDGRLVYVEKTDKDGVVTTELAMEAHEAPSAIDCARKFGTTVGKVQDIAKFSNFKYVDENFVTTAENIEAAKKWLVETPSSQNKELACTGHYDDAARLKLNEELDTLRIGTPAELEDYAAKRSSSFSRVRKSKEKTADGESTPANAETDVTGVNEHDTDDTQNHDTIAE